MNKILILPVFAALVFVMSYSVQDAHATSFTAISSGPWNSFSTWGASPPTIIGSADSVTIPSGIAVTITGIVTNNGHITIDAGGKINNVGTLNNKGTILINGIISNGGTLANKGTITNNGALNSIGTINNLVGGTITNIGTIASKGDINNKGTITNNGLIESKGNINNLTGGLIDNTGGGIIKNAGVITNHGTILQCAPSIIGRPPRINPVTTQEGCGPNVPEFPFAYSMIIMFVAVAAVYMGIRQKMSFGFKPF